MRSFHAFYEMVVSRRLEEADRLPLASVDKERCPSTCSSASVVWLVKLSRNWESKVTPEQAERIKQHIMDDEGEHLEGLQVNTDRFNFQSERLGKVVEIIPQEEEVRGIYAPGVKPISGSLTIRPRKTAETDAHGNYVGKDSAVRLPSEAIDSVKAIGGCALTCLHMSGGQVHAKTAGGYRKTHLYKQNQSQFYNTTLQQYVDEAITALYKNCRSDEKLDHYAIRLNGTTDIKHYANTFKVEQIVIDAINKRLSFLNNKSAKAGNPIYFKTVRMPQTERPTFFDAFNDIWKQATRGIQCDFNPTFLHFYDYTAIPALMRSYADKKLPDNYHITFSSKEGNLEETLEALRKGVGVALPIWLGGIKKAKTPFPQMWYPEGFSTGRGWKIVDGDSFDARFLDKKTYNIPQQDGYVIGLRAKGKLEDTEAFDSGFAERMLLNYSTPGLDKLQEFGRKFPTISMTSPNFAEAKSEFMRISGSRINPRFDPNDPAVNQIILEQIVYALRRNGVKINGLGKLQSKDFYDAQEKKGLKGLINIKDLDYDRLHGDMSGTSAKTEKGDVQAMSGTSAKVEKNAKLKVKTNQMNMLPHHTYSALKNQLDNIRAKTANSPLASESSLSFFGYVALREAFDLTNADMSDIMITSSATQGNYRFKHDGKNFMVSISQENEVNLDGHDDVDDFDYYDDDENNDPFINEPKTIEIPGTFSIMFSGPQDFQLTGTSGVGVFAIYRKLLSCVKHFMDNHEVNALEWTPADDKMLIPYDLFYRQFLQPDPPRGAGFIRVTNDVYIKKEYIRNNKDKFPPDLSAKILGTGRAVRVAIQDVKREEAQKKAKRRTLAVLMDKTFHAPGLKQYSGFYWLSNADPSAAMFVTKGKTSYNGYASNVGNETVCGYWDSRLNRLSYFSLEDMSLAEIQKFVDAASKNHPDLPQARKKLVEKIHMSGPQSQEDIAIPPDLRADLRAATTGVAR